MHEKYEKKLFIFKGNYRKNFLENKREIYGPFGTSDGKYRRK